MISFFKNNSFFWILIYACCFLFLVFYLVVIFNIRVTSDDFTLLYNLKFEGFFQSIINWEYNIRITSFTFFNAILFFSSDFSLTRWNLFIFYSLFFITFIFSIRALIKVILLKYTSVILNFFQEISLSILILMSIFFFSFQNNELWFWLTGTLIYLLPINFAILGFYFLMKQNFYASYIFFFLMGGCCETLTLIVVFILLLMYKESKYKNYKILISMILSLLLILLSAFFSGFLHRINSEHKLQVFRNFDLFSLFCLFFQKKNIFFVFIFIIFLVLGNLLRIKYQFDLRKYQKKTFIYFGILALISFFVTALLMQIVFKSIGPNRAWSTWSIIIGLELLIIALFIGNKIKFNVMIIANLSSIFLILLLFFYTFSQYRLTSLYATKYDEKINKMMIFKKNHHSASDTLILEPIPIDAGVLVSRSVDVHLSKILGTKFSVKYRENKK